MGCELWISHLFPKLGNSISKRLLFKGSFLKGYILSCGSTFWSIDPASCAASIFSSDPFGLEKNCIMLSCPLKIKKKSISEYYNFLYCGGGSLRRETVYRAAFSPSFQGIKSLLWQWRLCKLGMQLLHGL